jgi:hypothetical protein
VRPLSELNAVELSIRCDGTTQSIVLSDKSAVDLVMRLCTAARTVHEAEIRRRLEAGEDLADYNIDGADEGWPS